MPTITVEDGSGVTDANSYVSLATASVYFGERLYSTDWSSAATADQEKALIMSARLLDFHVEWEGAKVETDQAMQFPRSGLTNYDNDVVPPPLVMAQEELALTLLGKDVTAIPDGKGVAKEKVDMLEVTYNPGDRLNVVPDRIMSILGELGKLKGSLGVVKRTR